MKTSARFALRCLCILCAVVIAASLLTACGEDDKKSETQDSRYKTVTITTDSMEPEFKHGDKVVIDTEFNVSDLNADDIVAYYWKSDNSSEDNIVVHRISGVLVKEGKYSFQFKADQNDEVFPDIISEDYLIGKFDHVEK